MLLLCDLPLCSGLFFCLRWPFMWTYTPGHAERLVSGTVSYAGVQDFCTWYSQASFADGGDTLIQGQV